MSGIASAAIIGGASLAGSVGSGLLAKGAAGAAGGQSIEAANEAQARSVAQGNSNYAASSPYMSTGTGASGILGSLLGLGTLTGNSNGIGAGYVADPNARTNALANIRALASGSGATLPTYNAFNPMTTVSDTFTADPSYAWRLSEGQKSLDRSAASKGMLLSGAQLKASSDYNENAASQEYANWFQRYNAQQQFNLGVNNQNFGQQQTLYGDEQGQWDNALALLTGAANTGAGSAGAYNAAGSGLTANTNNGGITAGNAAAGFTNQGGQDLASGVGSGINNALTAYLLRNKFSGSGGGSSIYTGSPGGGPNGQ